MQFGIPVDRFTSANESRHRVGIAKRCRLVITGALELQVQNCGVNSITPGGIRQCPRYLRVRGGILGDAQAPEAIPVPGTKPAVIERCGE